MTSPSEPKAPISERTTPFCLSSRHPKATPPPQIDLLQNSPELTPWRFPTLTHLPSSIVVPACDAASKESQLSCWPPPLCVLMPLWQAFRFHAPSPAQALRCRPAAASFGDLVRGEAEVRGPKPATQMVCDLEARMHRVGRMEFGRIRPNAIDASSGRSKAGSGGTTPEVGRTQAATGRDGAKRKGGGIGVELSQSGANTSGRIETSLA